MNQLVDRYVYDDVTRRLPESERAEVGKELKANIYDMLSDNPDDDEIKVGFISSWFSGEIGRAIPTEAALSDFARVLRRIYSRAETGIAVGWHSGHGFGDDSWSN